MVKLNAFQIHFLDSPQGVYTAGQLMHGQLYIDLNEPMEMNSIALEFYGYAYVYWIEEFTIEDSELPRGPPRGGKNILGLHKKRTRKVMYTNHEVYFKKKIFIWGTEGGLGRFENNPVHPAGQHVYPFQFQLPPNLPSSFESFYGRIRYSITATIDKPWKYDHTTKVPFTIQTVYDLNIYPEIRESEKNRVSKTLCCLCCASGPISAMCQTNRRGYVPGEFIVVNAEVDNKSNRAINRIKVEFRMVSSFKAGNKKKTKRVYKTLDGADRYDLAPGNVETISEEKIHVPPLPPSDLKYCNIIDLKYYVTLIADISGPFYDLECPIEILIGNVPLQDVCGIYANSPLPPPPDYEEVEGDQGDQYCADLNKNVLASSLSAPPPPTYAASAFGRVNIREEQDNQYTRGNMQYAPLYNYYSFGNQQNAPY